MMTYSKAGITQLNNKSPGAVAGAIFECDREKSSK